MTDLIAELERSTEGSKDLDMKIFWLQFPEYERGKQAIWHCPDYTTSLDAALTLVPRGWRRKILDWPDGIGPEKGGAKLEWLDSDGIKRPVAIPREGWIWAATPALALCIAALKARQSQEVERETA